MIVRCDVIEWNIACEMGTEFSEGQKNARKIHCEMRWSVGRTLGEVNDRFGRVAGRNNAIEDYETVEASESGCPFEAKETAAHGKGGGSGFCEKPGGFLGALAGFEGGTIGGWNAMLNP
jgi:hypothetical protein